MPLPDDTAETFSAQTMEQAAGIIHAFLEKWDSRAEAQTLSEYP
jgi:hypothetical protein